MKRLFSILVALLAIACVTAQSVKLNNGTVEVTGDLSVAQVVTNWQQLIVPASAPRQWNGQVITYKVTAIKFDSGLSFATNSSVTNATWLLSYETSPGVTNVIALAPLGGGK